MRTDHAQLTGEELLALPTSDLPPGQNPPSFEPVADRQLKQIENQSHLAIMNEPSDAANNTISLPFTNLMQVSLTDAVQAIMPEAHSDIEECDNVSVTELDEYILNDEEKKEKKRIWREAN